MEENADLKKLMDEFLDDDIDIILVNLCTADGFDISHKGNGDIAVESDKVSAMASTFCAMSRSVSELILKKKFEISSVEMNDGHILFSSTEYIGRPCVLTAATRGGMSLGEARYKTKRLSERIEQVQ